MPRVGLVLRGKPRRQIKNAFESERRELLMDRATKWQAEIDSKNGVTHTQTVRTYT